VGVT